MHDKFSDCKKNTIQNANDETTNAIIEAIDTKIKSRSKPLNSYNHFYSILINMTYHT